MNTSLTLMTDLNELKFDEFGHAVCLVDSEHDGDDVISRVADLPQMCHDLVGGVDVCVHTVLQHLLHK